MPRIDIASALQRRPRVFALGCTASVLIAVASLLVVDLWSERQRMLRDAELRAENAAKVVAEYLRGAFAIAGTALGQLAIHARQVGGAPAPTSSWKPLLDAAHAALQGTGSISVADADGIIRHSTNPGLIGQSRREQYIFRLLSAKPLENFIVDTPFRTPAGRYVIPVGRRLSGPGGSFEGVIVTSVQPEAYRQFIRTIDVGRSGSIAVLHPEGVVVFREPSTSDPAGEPVSDNPLFQTALQRRGNSLVDSPLIAGGPVFLNAYRTLDTPPLIVTVSLSRDEVLAGWYHQRQVSSLAFTALTLTLGAILVVLFRQIDARSRIQRELAEMQRQESVRLREANERLEAALAREQQARREWEAASCLKDEFLMTVSHELRTPLTAIFGWIRMLAAGALPEQERARHCGHRAERAGADAPHRGPAGRLARHQRKASDRSAADSRRRCDSRSR